MSILIKGMDMPKSCSDCEIRIECGCKVANSSGWLNNKIDDHCPFAFAEVPTPHGRLIEADKLMDKIRRYDDGELWREEEVYFTVKGMPTIIEAEE